MTISCPKCEAANDDDASLCRICGYSLDGSMGIKPTHYKSAIGFVATVAVLYIVIVNYPLIQSDLRHFAYNVPAMFEPPLNGTNTVNSVNTITSTPPTTSSTSSMSSTSSTTSLNSTSSTSSSSTTTAPTTSTTSSSSSTTSSTTVTSLPTTTSTIPATSTTTIPTTTIATSTTTTPSTSTTTAATTSSSTSSTTSTTTMPPPISTPTISPSSNQTYNAGNTIPFASYVAGGVPPYTYSFFVYNALSNAVVANMITTSNTFNWIIPQSMAGSTLVANVFVHDSQANSTTANSIRSGTLKIQ